jgi:hypothetical protein
LESYPTIEQLADFLLTEHSSKLPPKMFQDNIVATTQQDVLPFYDGLYSFLKSCVCYSYFTVNLEGGEQLAIIGMSCRVPKAKNTDEFWNNLVSGADCISKVH